ncbi:phage terminase small subunit [Paenibacillus filicis]|uniref:Phage terminase small subunit n=1 Tax=Paenibacillus gyeongsangnamensis TaxID=3388067 RepID=A0ABT4QJG2_9BACL|nr:phage terminase small subunit [Paenibacillus filicis]MCZ8516835.1 phage terminase small subunit [Paenibacillus filicis]
MSRTESPARKKALQMWIKSGRTLKPKEIAEKLGVSDAMVRKWKSVDKWVDIPDPQPRKRGAPKGNRNAKGNKGGPGGPPGNAKAVKHGFFRKFFPQDPEFLEIMDMVEQMDPLDMIWSNIVTLYQQIIWGQRIMFVENKEDMTKEIRKTKTTFFGGEDGGSAQEDEWEIQFAWDKFANAIKAQAVVMREIRGQIKQFQAAAPENYERRLKLEQMQAQIEKTKLVIGKIKGDDSDTEDDGFIDCA